MEYFRGGVSIWSSTERVVREWKGREKIPRLVFAPVLELLHESNHGSNIVWSRAQWASNATLNNDLEES